MKLFPDIKPTKLPLWKRFRLLFVRPIINVDFDSGSYVAAKKLDGIVYIVRSGNVRAEKPTFRWPRYSRWRARRSLVYFVEKFVLGKHMSKGMRRKLRAYEKAHKHLQVKEQTIPSTFEGRSATTIIIDDPFKPANQ